MVMLSYHIRGLVAPHKKIALEHLIKTQKLDVISIQETMIYGAKVVNNLSTFLKGWSLCANDVEGKSGRQVTIWNRAFSLQKLEHPLGGI